MFINSILSKLKLIYRGSRDGFTVKNFKEKCYKNFEKMVILIWNDKNYIFGGYSTQKFERYGNYCNDEYAFLFNLKRMIKGKEIWEPKIYNIKDKQSQYAIRYHDWALLQFGITPNIFICENCDSRYGSTVGFEKDGSYDINGAYELSGYVSNDKFMVNDIEVFKVYSAVIR